MPDVTMTIRTRLTLWYTGMLTLIILLFSVAVISMNRVSILAILDQTLNEVARTVGNSLHMVPVGETLSAETQILPSEIELFQKTNMWVQVWQTRKNGVAITPMLVRASDGLDASDGMLHADPRAETQLFVAQTTFNGIETRVASQPLTIDGVQMGVIQVGTSTASIADATRALSVSVAIAAIICILVSVGLGMWIAERMLKPIEAITATAASIVNADDLKKRLIVTEPMDEIGQLASVFNHTLARLDNVFQVQQRFVGDVSHELRTPLTSILGNLEIMQRYGHDADSMDAVHREAERMSRMVNDLLLLARADNGELRIDLVPLEFDPIVVEVYEQAFILAKKRALKIRVGTIDEVSMRGSRDRIKQLLLNLVNNAIKFTPDGGTITLSLVRRGTQAVLEVRDTGIGISSTDQKRVFDRFFQADDSRVHRNEHDGAGLGLSIVRWIINAHNGVVEIDSELGVGTTFRVIFPALDLAANGKTITKEWLVNS